MNTTRDIQMDMILHSDSHLSQESKSCFTPGDMIHGSVHISSKKIFRTLNASVFLEGVSRIWITKAPGGNDTPAESMTATDNFLRQTLDIPDSKIEEPKASSLGFESSLPFLFVISKKLLPTRNDAPDHFLQLPPSIELGSVHIATNINHRYAQPNVSYNLRALVVFAAENNSFWQMESAMSITLLPQTQVYPPTEICDFPDEFRVQATKHLKKRFFGKTAGSFKVSVQEPPPIIYDSNSSNGTTKCRLNFLFFPQGEATDLLALRNMRINILSILRQKTFYSVKAFTRIPSHMLVNGKGNIRMHNEYTKSEVEHNVSPAWVLNEEISGETEGSDQVYEPKGKTSTVSNASTLSQIFPDRQAKWTLSLDLPIVISLQLQPTFCSSLVAILYSIIIRVQIRGIKRDYLDLEVPVQVIHDFKDKVTGDRHLGAEEHWASTPTWLNRDPDGELSLPPPRYSK